MMNPFTMKISSSFLILSPIHIQLHLLGAASRTRAFSVSPSNRRIFRHQGYHHQPNNRYQHTQYKSYHSTSTCQFGTKRDTKNQNGGIIPGSITIYNHSKTKLPSPNNNNDNNNIQDQQPINIQKLEQTITIIRNILSYNTYDINLILMDDDEMRTTNFESRGIDKPTDILSFPFHDTVLGGAKGGAGELELPDFDIPEYYVLGDMLIDVPYVMRRCEEDRIYYETGEIVGDDGDDDTEEEDDDEYEDYVGDDDRGVSGAMSRIYDTEERIQLLLVHGMLHLVGYDHIEDDDYEVMVTKEEEVLKILQAKLKEL